MTGNERHGLVIQERDRHLLREISIMRVIDREQAKVVAGFSSTTRVNVRLLALTRSDLLHRFFLGTTAGGAKALYTLSAKGARLVDAPETGPRRRSDETVVADFFIAHQLATNEVYCALKYGKQPMPGIMFKRWVAFSKQPTPGLRLIPDGYVELETPVGIVAAFLEVDLGHERPKVWQDKVRNYLDLAVSGNFTREFGQSRFRVLVVATSQRRLNAIRQVVAASTEKIFWFAILESIQQCGCFAPIWLRPKGDEPQPLIREML